MTERGFLSSTVLLPFNRNVLLALHSLRILLGDVQPQGAVLKLRLDVFHRNGRPHIEAAGAGAAVPFLTDVLALLILFILVQ